MTQESVAVAMSGGVDSSVAAYLLREEGHKVIGLTLNLFDDDISRTIDTKGAKAAITDAREVCDFLGIPHYVVNAKDAFRKDVVDPFIAAYRKGLTPNPCVRCNRFVKEKALIEAAKERGMTQLVTGHYARIEDTPDGKALYRGTDETRDQSYFLSFLKREQVAFLRFPLAEMSKKEVRAIAEKAGLPVAHRPDSQDVCFIPSGTHADFIDSFTQEKSKTGDFIHAGTGKVLGQHKGLEHYTIGQRKGLGLGGLTEPLYVSRLDGEENTVYLDKVESLAKAEIHIDNLNWIGPEADFPNSFTAEIKCRSRQEPVPARIDKTGEDTATVTPDTPFSGVAPGQLCAFFQDGRALGSGIITG